MENEVLYDDKKDQTEYGNYRGISPRTHAGKVLLNIVAMRLSNHYDVKGLLPKER